MGSLGILVLSCDKNKWLLKIFFEQFAKFWPGCPYNVYLSMEHGQFQYQGINIINISHKGKMEWCARTKEALQKMKEDYVLILLDDFIIEEPVNEYLLNYFFSILKENELSNIILTPVPNEKNYMDCPYKQLLHRNRFGRYKTSLQCGIWKKKVLQELLVNDENAWEFEIFGNIRSFLVDDNFYALKNRDDKPIAYNDGFFVVQGKVNMIEKQRLEKKIGISIDIGAADFFEDKIIRDNIRLIPKIFRRLKIIWMNVIYRIKYIGSNI